MISRQRWRLAVLLILVFAIRAIHRDQPIVENYVGRQIPTAMVARNLERGSGFLHPQLDTGPFPNLFLVEPPIYAQLVVFVRPILGLRLEPTGRLVSALAVTLGAWGLFGLVRRREGEPIALVALGSFGLFPVMIRYGRAFQPDALMVGCVLVGLRAWDEFDASGQKRWALSGGFVLSMGVALKLTVGWALLPFLLIVRRWPIRWRLATALAMLLPALLWYLHAWTLVSSSGSLASSDNAELWRHALSPVNWLRFSTFETIGLGLIARSFTPLGFVLGAWGLLACGRLDRLWVGWWIGSGLSIVALASKWHHAYYWMVVAPLMAVGVGRALVGLARWRGFGRVLSVGLGSILVGLCGIQSLSTWRTPREWDALADAVAVLDRVDLSRLEIVASEAVLFASDRRGFRLELSPVAASRAAGEWKGHLVADDASPTFDPASPIELVEFYKRLQDQPRSSARPTALSRVNRSLSGLSPSPTEDPDFSPIRDPDCRPLLVADVGLTDHEPRRRAWREALRRRPQTKILADHPGYLIAELH